MVKKLFILSLVVLLVYLPLFSQNSNAVEKNSTGVILSDQKVNLGKDKKSEKPIPKRDYDKYEFDEASRITKIISKDKGVTKYVYNELGKLESKINSNSESEHYYYDLLGRRTKIEYKSNGEKDAVEFKYSTPADSYKLGNLNEKIEKTEHSFYKYAGRRLKEEKKIIRGHEFLVKYNYNEKGLLSEIHYPSGLIVSYKYDDKNKIENIFVARDNKKESVLKYIREKESIDFKFGNELTTSFYKNKEKGTVRVRTGNVQDLIFSFNKKGLISKVIDKKNSRNKKEFYYDAEDRLITAYGPWGKISYRYDSMDNLKTKIEKDYKMELSYNKKSSRIKELKENGNNVEIKYDKLGRMTQYREIYFKYNTRGKLEKILKNDAIVVELFYNYKNQRVMEKNGNNTFYYIYDNQDRVLAQYDNNGKIMKEYIYSKEFPVGFMTDSKIYYYHYDLMNFPKTITDNTGKVVRKVEYKPYGEIIKSEGTITDNLRFPGQYKIPGTNLFYNYHRTYSPSLTRYFEPDLIINTENIYQYTSGNPIKYFDLMGLKMNCYFFDLYVKEISGLLFYWKVLRGKNVRSDDCNSECFKKDGKWVKLTQGEFVARSYGIGLIVSLPFTFSYLFAKGISNDPSRFPYPQLLEFYGKVIMFSGNLLGTGFDNNIGAMALRIGNVWVHKGTNRPGDDLAFPELSVKAGLFGAVSIVKSGEYKCCPYYSN